MRKNIIRSCLFVILFTLLAYIANCIVDNGLRKTKSKDFYYYYGVWNDIYASKINADIIFSGSSRTYVQLSPKIFDSILNLNCYNLGMDGWNFSMQYVRFKAYIQHNVKPKYVIQNVDFTFLENRKDLFEYIQFVPYIYDTLIYNACKQYEGAFTLADLYFPLFKYNNQFDAIKDGLKSYFHFGKSEPTGIIKGYFPNVKKWDTSFDNFKKSNPNGISRPLDEKLLSVFESFLAYCQANDIIVILDFAPIYHEEMLLENSKQQYFDAFNKLSKKYNMPFLDYTNDSLCYNKFYFYNSQHLNKIGSEIFSAHLAMDVKNIMARR